MAVTEVQTYHIECQETTQWIRDKARLIQATEELGNDLGGIMVLQRRLKGMESDLAAIEAKVTIPTISTEFYGRVTMYISSQKNIRSKDLKLSHWVWLKSIQKSCIEISKLILN